MKISNPEEQRGGSAREFYKMRNAQVAENLRKQAREKPRRIIREATLMKSKC